MNAHAKPMNIADTAEAAVNVAKKAGQMSDRSWLAILMLFGMVALTVIFYWHREDQKATTELFRETIKSNTEALIKVQVALDRLERSAR